MTSQLLFAGLLALVGLERLAELVLARRNAAWSFARGGREHGRAHYRVMVVLHTALLAGALAESVLLDRPLIPAVAAVAGMVVVFAQGLRWWCIATLGPQWNTRVIVVPGAPRRDDGPYRWLRHPNYVAVVAEGLALPLFHGAWVTALAFTALNAWLLRVRIRCEEAALAELATTASAGAAAAADDTGDLEPAPSGSTPSASAASPARSPGGAARPGAAPPTRKPTSTEDTGEVEVPLPRPLASPSERARRVHA